MEISNFRFEISDGRNGNGNGTAKAKATATGTAKAWEISDFGF
jgi:hypothetical protein